MSIFLSISISIYTYIHPYPVMLRPHVCRSPNPFPHSSIPFRSLLPYVTYRLVLCPLIRTHPLALPHFSSPFPPSSSMIPFPWSDSCHLHLWQQEAATAEEQQQQQQQKSSSNNSRTSQVSVQLFAITDRFFSAAAAATVAAATAATATAAAATGTAAHPLE